MLFAWSDVWLSLNILFTAWDSRFLRQQCKSHWETTRKERHGQKKNRRGMSPCPPSHHKDLGYVAIWIAKCSDELEGSIFCSNRVQGCKVVIFLMNFSSWMKLKRLRAPNSDSGVSDQQSVGLNPQLWHLCPSARHLTIASSFGWDVKPLVPCVV